MDYSKNFIYFTGTDNIVLMGIGFIVGLMGFGCFQSVYSAGKILGLLMLLAGAALIYGGMKKWPVSDSDYDNSVKGYISNLKPRALNKLGVDESEVSEVPPIILGGYDFENVERVKQGQDGKWRSNIYKVIALFFSPHELHSYTLTFNTLRNAQNEGTDVYFYQDIVSVSTSSLTVKTTVDGKEITVNNPETFKLTTKGLASLTVNLLDARHVEESINAMRALIREKKQG